MAGSLRESVSGSLAAFGAVLHNRNLRLIQLAGICSETGKWLYLVALLVYAHGVGGATAVSVVALIRIVPSAVAAPFSSVLADRYSRQRVLFWTSAARTVSYGAMTAIVAAAGPYEAVFALAGFVTLLSTVFRPAEAAIMPSLSHTPEELTAANVAASTIVSIGSFAGPAIGGPLLALTSVQTVFAVTGATLLAATVVLAFLPRDARPERVERAGGFRGEASAGFRTIAADRKLGLLVLLYGAQTVVAGALGVLIVIAALDLLDIGDAGVGYLNAAIGAGGFLGVGLTFVLVGRQRLASDFAFGMMLWGIPVVLMGVIVDPVAAVVLLVIVGVGDVLIEVAAPTLLQRAVPDEVLGRVFGAVEAVVIGGMGVGAVAAPLLNAAFGTRGALIATGAFLPVLAIVSWRALIAIDRETTVPVHELDRLRAIPIFAPLPPAAIEELAARLVAVSVAAGEDVFRQGEHGDRFYVVDEGEVEVRVDGKPVRRQAEGESFGEIALLRDVPRTATVTATGATRLLALDRDDFLGAVTGHAESREAADTVVGARLTAARPPGLALE